MPKTVSDGGRTLTLANVNWSSSNQTEGEDVVQRYTATATCTGSATSKSATGYKVTANYTGDLSKTGCKVVTYTAIFGGEELTPAQKEAAKAVSDGGSVGFTDVTPDRSNGSLGTLKIPAIGVNSKIIEGTGSASLAKGIGHFTGTSIWNGNVCVAAHNRGTNAIFGRIHTLSIGDEIILTTKQGTRTYSVTSVEKVSETDTSGTASTSDNRITLYTCVRDQRDLRLFISYDDLDKIIEKVWDMGTISQLDSRR